MQAVIGALRAVLGMDSLAFEQGIGQAQKSLSSLTKSFEKTSKDLSALGSVMSVAITAPIAAWRAASIKAGSDFEDAMRDVTKATGFAGDKISELSDLAKKLGVDTGVGATKAAGVIADLGKHGTSAAEIMAGAAEASIRLAKANGVDLAEGTKVADRVMKIFGGTTGDLKERTELITAAVRASDLTFQDYSGALNGGASNMAKLGVKFGDFNATLASVSGNFSDGSEAAASFMNFMLKITPATKEAKDGMKAAGLEFFDAKGSFIGLEAAADMLQKRLGDLNDLSKGEVIEKLFGRRAMGAVLALTKEGGDGIRKMRDQIAEMAKSGNATTPVDSLTISMKKLGAAIENLQIAVAQSGLLKWAIDLTDRATHLVNAISNMNPEFLKFASIAATIAASLGPVLLAFAGVSSILARFGKAIAAIVPAMATILTWVLPWLRLAIAILAAAAAIVVFGDDIPATLEGSVKLSDYLKAIGDNAAKIDFSGATKQIDNFGKAVVETTDQTALDQWFAELEKHMSLDGVVKILAMGLDRIVGYFLAAGGVMRASWSGLVDVIGERFKEMANLVIQGTQDAVNGAIDALNYLRRKVGATEFGKLSFDKYAADSEAAATAAGKAIADALNKGFAYNVFSTAAQKIAEDALTNAMNRMIGLAQEPPPVSTEAPKKGTFDYGNKGGRSLTLPDASSNNMKTALQRISEERKALDEAAKFLQSSGIASEALLFKSADELARIGQKTADMLKGLDPNSDQAKKIRDQVTALEQMRTSYSNLQESIKKAFEIEAQYGNGQAQHTETLRQLNEALGTNRVSQDAFNEAVKQAGYALDDARNKAVGAKGGLDGFIAGFSYAADQVSRQNTVFNAGQKAFTELTSAISEAANAFIIMGTSAEDVLKRLGQRILAFALETLALQPLFNAIKSMISGALNGGSSGGGGIGGWIMNLIGGGTGAGAGAGPIAGGVGEGIAMFAGGGKPKPGVPYVVGENGPEIRVDGPGTIFPNVGDWYSKAARGMSGGAAPMMTSSEFGDGVGGQTVINHLNFSLGVQSTVRAEIKTMLPAIADAGARRGQVLRQQGGQFKESFKR